MFADLYRRSGTIDDMDLMFSISKRALRSHVEENFGPWDEEQQRAMFFRSTDPTTHQLLFLHDEPVGYFWLREEKDDLHLNRITILPSFQNKGLGTSLIREFMQRATQRSIPLRLRVFPSNPALQLYKRLGFLVEEQTDKHIHLLFHPSC